MLRQAQHEDIKLILTLGLSKGEERVTNAASLGKRPEATNGFV
jgi:hypothetical protein